MNFPPVDFCNLRADEDCKSLRRNERAIVIPTDYFFRDWRISVSATTQKTKI
jgi:hypothetical protein